MNKVSSWVWWVGIILGVLTGINTSARNDYDLVGLEILFAIGIYIAICFVIDLIVRKSRNSQQPATVKKEPYIHPGTAMSEAEFNEQRKVKGATQPAMKTFSSHPKGSAEKYFSKGKAVPHKTFCDNCKEEVREEAKFCHHCGFSFESPTCSACGSGILKDSNFCDSCGNTIEIDIEHKLAGKYRLILDPVAKIYFPDDASKNSLSKEELSAWWFLWEVARESQRRGESYSISDEEATLLRSPESIDSELKIKITSLIQYAMERASNNWSPEATTQLSTGLEVPRGWDVRMEHFNSRKPDWALIGMIENSGWKT